MSERRDATHNERFWETMLPLQAEDDVEEGTMMQFPCLRSGGEFFAMPKHDSDAAVMKLPAERVRSLVSEGIGEPFGPGDKVFKEWVLVPVDHDGRWLELAREARAFVNPAAG